MSADVVSAPQVSWMTDMWVPPAGIGVCFSAQIDTAFMIGNRSAPASVARYSWCVRRSARSKRHDVPLSVFAATIANRWFVERRGLVMGVLTAGGATGQLVFLPVVAAFANNVG